MRHYYDESSVLRKRERERHLAIGGFISLPNQVVASRRILPIVLPHPGQPHTIITNYGNTRANNEFVCSLARLRLPARGRFSPTTRQPGEALMSSHAGHCDLVEAGEGTWQDLRLIHDHTPCFAYYHPCKAIIITVQQFLDNVMDSTVA